VAAVNKTQEELVNDIHTSVDLGISLIEGNSIEVMVTSGETTVEDTVLREVEDDKEYNVLDQDLRQETPEPEPVGSSTPRHSTENLVEYVEDAENMGINKEEMFEADTLEVKEAQALGTPKTEPPRGPGGQQEEECDLPPIHHQEARQRRAILR
jgi:hypothetical protein